MLNNKIKSLIENEQFYHQYQPLYSLNNGSRIGFEALFRTSNFKNPEIVFESARNENRPYELETKSISKAITSYTESGVTIKFLFINVFPSTISNPIFPKFINKIVKESRIKSEQIIFEINETETVPDDFPLKKGIEDLKKQGFLFTIDDVGKGSASLRSIIELKPNYIKMDRYFALNLSTSEQKQEMIKSVLTYCKNTNTHFILEGIENASDLQMAKDLGVLCGQGFLLGRPATFYNRMKC